MSSIIYVGIIIFVCIVLYNRSQKESRNSPLSIFPGTQDLQKISNKNFRIFEEIVKVNNLGSIDQFEDFIVLPQFGIGLGFTATTKGDKYNVVEKKIFLQPSIAGSQDFLVAFEDKKYDISNRQELFKYRPRSDQWIEFYENEKLSNVYIVRTENKFNTVTTFIFEYNWFEDQTDVCLVFACHMDDLNIAERLKKMCKTLKYPVKNCSMDFIKQQNKYSTLFTMGQVGKIF